MNNIQAIQKPPASDYHCLTFRRLIRTPGSTPMQSYRTQPAVRRTAMGASLIACSGQAATHSRQAWQSCPLTTSACLPPCAHALSFPRHVRALRCSLLRTSIRKTSKGQTRTQSALPSQRFRSITGATVPARPDAPARSADIANAGRQVAGRGGRMSLRARNDLDPGGRQVLYGDSLHGGPLIGKRGLYRPGQ